AAPHQDGALADTREHVATDHAVRHRPAVKDPDARACDVLHDAVLYQQARRQHFVVGRIDVGDAAARVDVHAADLLGTGAQRRVVAVDHQAVERHVGRKHPDQVLSAGVGASRVVGGCRHHGFDGRIGFAGCEGRQPDVGVHTASRAQYQQRLIYGDHLGESAVVNVDGVAGAGGVHRALDAAAVLRDVKVAHPPGDKPAHIIIQGVPHAVFDAEVVVEYQRAEIDRVLAPEVGSGADSVHAGGRQVFDEHAAGAAHAQRVAAEAGNVEAAGSDAHAGA